MRRQLMQAHHLGHDDEVRLISGIDGSPKDATEVFILYLALEAARGSYDALVACNALKEYVFRLEDNAPVTAFASLNLQTQTAKKKGGDVE